jgi:hypothetical protein
LKKVLEAEVNVDIETNKMTIVTGDAQENTHTAVVCLEEEKLESEKISGLKQRISRRRKRTIRIQR